MSEHDPDEAIAMRRYTLMNLARLASVVALAVGIAMAREAVPGPYLLGVALAIAGVAGFFFVPPMLAKRWKSGDEGGE